MELYILHSGVLYKWSPVVFRRIFCQEKSQCHCEGFTKETSHFCSLRSTLPWERSGAKALPFLLPSSDRIETPLHFSSSIFQSFMYFPDSVNWFFLKDHVSWLLQPEVNSFLFSLVFPLLKFCLPHIQTTWVMPSAFLARPVFFISTSMHSDHHHRQEVSKSHKIPNLDKMPYLVDIRSDLGRGLLCLQGFDAFLPQRKKTSLDLLSCS